MKPRLTGVVFVAAPESGIHSLAKLFSSLSGGLGAAFVVAVPGFAGSVERLRDIVGPPSGLDAKVVKEKDKLEPHTIHILPANRISTLKKSRFVLGEKRGAQKGLVDSFLLSLAQDQGDKAIGIILSGVNGDGTLGLTALKEAGGLAVAERVGGDLQEDMRKVLRRLHTVEREVDDATATARAERALKESEERFRNIAQTVPAFLFIATPSLEWEYVNPPFYHYTGLSEGDAVGSGWRSVLHPDDAQEIRRRMTHSVETGVLFDAEFRLRGIAGDYQWFLGRAEAIGAADGSISKWYGSAINIHARKTAEGRHQLLLSELQHRVKNILAVVRSLANRTAEQSDSVDNFIAHFDGRLSAMGRTQNILARTAEGGVELAELVQDELAGHVAHYDQVEVAGPEVKLRAKPAETLSLAIHELATNAVKYGALSTRSGRIAVSWHVEKSAGMPRLAFEWQESGVPVVDQSPSRSGFGRELIERGLPYELKATTALEFRQGGIRCVIELPINEKVAIVEGG